MPIPAEWGQRSRSLMIIKWHAHWHRRSVATLPSASPKERQLSLGHFLRYFKNGNLAHRGIAPNRDPDEIPVLAHRNEPDKLRGHDRKRFWRMESQKYFRHTQTRPWSPSWCPGDPALQRARAEPSRPSISPGSPQPPRQLFLHTSRKFDEGNLRAGAFKKRTLRRFRKPRTNYASGSTMNFW